MELKGRTTYRRSNGRLVHIAGLTGESFEGSPLWWSIEGDHYTSDGFLMSVRLEGEERRYVKFKTDSRIVEELTEPEHVRWWNGVVTDRRNK
jgi:hypothetical protein